MNFYRYILSANLIALGMLGYQGSAKAETYDTCVGFIESIPTTISTQGVWCLKKDLGTDIRSGAAITIASNNVTIDCNQFKLGGLAAGKNSQASGIHATSRQNISVRNCTIRGFYSGVSIEGADGAGHLIEDNRLDANLHHGISVHGENNLVRRNMVYNTGLSALSDTAYGIHAQGADIIDNVVSGLTVDSELFTARYIFGIVARGDGVQVSNNRVRGLNRGYNTTGGYAWGIDAAYSSNARISDNHVSAGGTQQRGIWVMNGANTICKRNTVFTFHDALTNCIDGGGNIAN